MSALILFTGLSLGACASNDKGTIVEGDLVIHDPYEKYNRTMFAFNRHVDDLVINPFIEGYRYVAPSPVRTGIRNFLRNIKSPVLFANELLQGDLDGAKNCFLRAAINSTVGIGGLIDLAGYNGIEYEVEDFGQTLAVWGVGDGPYVVVPFLGPSSLRDYSGYFVDGYADPLRWYLFNTHNVGTYYTKATAEYLDMRESIYDTLKDTEENSFDYYAATRSIYYQSRRAMIYDLGQSSGFGAPAIPDYDEE